MTGRRRTLLAVVGIVVAASLLGSALWWRADSGTPSASPSAAGGPVASDGSVSAQCGGYSGPATRIRFAGEGGTPIVGAVTGPKGSAVAVVIRQGSSSQICPWLPWADRIAADTGSRVVLFDRRGMGATGGTWDTTKEPADIRAAIELARAEGSGRFALVGASLGTTVLQEVVPTLSEPPCALVLVSPVSAVLDRLPENTWLAWETQGAAVDQVARTLATRARSPSDVHTLPVATSHHSGRLVREHPEVLPFLVDAVRSCRN